MFYLFISESSLHIQYRWMKKVGEEGNLKLVSILVQLNIPADCLHCRVDLGCANQILGEARLRCYPQKCAWCCAAASGIGSPAQAGVNQRKAPGMQRASLLDPQHCFILLPLCCTAVLSNMPAVWFCSHFTQRCPSTHHKVVVANPSKRQMRDKILPREGRVRLHFNNKNCSLWRMLLELCCIKNS